MVLGLFIDGDWGLGIWGEAASGLSDASVAVPLAVFPPRLLRSPAFQGLLKSISLGAAIISVYSCGNIINTIKLYNVLFIS